MKLIKNLLFTLTLSLLFLDVSASADDSPQKSNFIKQLFKGTSYIKTDIVVHFEEEPTQKELRKLKAVYKLKRVKQTVSGSDVYKLSFSKGTDLTKLASKLVKESNVSYVEPNYTFKLTYLPKDKHYAKQWYLKKVQSEKAWDLTKGSNHIVVAVIDGGVQIDHPDLKGKIYKPYKVATGKSNTDADDHGTHVAGIIGASMNNIGITGVAPNVKIMPVDVFTNDYATVEDVYKGIMYAADQGADIINLSISSYYFSKTLDDAVKYAQNKGSIVVSAAGNDNTKNVSYPAGYTGVIGVSATDKNDGISYFSNYGETVDISAPGEDIFSTISGSGYTYFDGTSMAAPLVSGSLGLMLSKNPFLTQDEAVNILKASSKDLGTKGWDRYYGFGRLDVHEAVKNTPKPVSSIKLSSSPFKTNGKNLMSISFKAHVQTKVSVLITDSKGKTIQTVKENLLSRGKGMKVEWDGKDSRGAFISEGSYKIIVKVSKGNNFITQSSAVKVADHVLPILTPSSQSLFFSTEEKSSVPVTFWLNKAGKVSANVYDYKGKLVKKLSSLKNYNGGNGALSWDGKNLKGKRLTNGTYYVKLEFQDHKQKKAKAAKVQITIDNLNPKVHFKGMSLTKLKEGIDPFITAKYTTSENGAVTVYIMSDKNQVVRSLTKNSKIKAGTHALQWDGKTDKKEFVSEGKYKYLFEVRDQAGNKSTLVSSWFQVEDWVKPQITSADNKTFFDGSKGVTLPYTISKKGNVSITIYKDGKLIKDLLVNQTKEQGNQNFSWDGKNNNHELVDDGQYQFIITLKDKYNQQITYKGNMNISFAKAEITVPKYVQYYPYQNKSGEVYYNLSLPASVSIEIMDSKGIKVRTINEPGAFSSGNHHFEWDGKDNSGNYATDYGYTYPIQYVIKAVKGTGNETVKTGSFIEMTKPEWITDYNSMSNISGFKVSLRAATINNEVIFEAFDQNGNQVDLVNTLLASGVNEISYTKPESYLEETLLIKIYLKDELGNLYEAETIRK